MRGLIRVILCVFALQMAVPSAYAETVTIVGNPWCPYNCDPQSSRPGLFIEIAHKALEKEGITVDYKTMPWARALQDTELGKYTAIAGAMHSNAKDFVFPNIPQAQSVVSFYVKKGSHWTFESMDSLKRVSLGTISDYSYSPALDSYIAQNKHDMRRIQEVSGDLALGSNVKKLMIGRIGALVENTAVMDYYSGIFNVRNDIVPAGTLPNVDSQNLYIAFSPRDPNAQKYASLIADETKRLISSGEMDTLRARYGLPSLATSTAPDTAEDAEP